MSDPLACLRSYYQAGKLEDIKLKEGKLFVFGDSVFARDTKTNFRIHGSKTGDDGGWDYYTLENLLSFLRIDGSPDRLHLLGYLDGSIPEMHFGTVDECIDGNSERREIQTQKNTSVPVKTTPSKCKKESAAGKTLRSAMKNAFTRKKFDTSQSNVVEVSRLKASTKPSTSGKLNELSVEQDSSSQNRFLALPDEIVIKILSHIELRDVATSVSVVNRRFRQLGMDASLWTWLELPDEQCLGHRAAIDVLQRCPKLDDLTMRDREDSVYLAVHALQRCPSLSRLALKLSDNLEDLLVAIGQYGTALQDLTLFGNWYEGVLEANAGCLKELRCLTVGSSCFNDASLWEVASSCRFLEEVDLTRVDSADLSCETMAFFLKRVQGTIRSLQIMGIFNYEGLENLGKCLQLERLEIYSALSLPSYGFRIIANLRKLKMLIVTDVMLTTNSRCELVGLFGDRKWRELTWLHLDTIGRLNLDREDKRMIEQSCHLSRRGGPNRVRFDQCDRCNLTWISMHRDIACMHIW